MKKILLTKYFHFSVSFSKDGKIHGRNFVLGVTVDGLDEREEINFERSVRSALIEKMDSRDLSLDVEFLKEIVPTDTNLLNAFYKILTNELKPILVHSLTLDRDKNTRTTLRVKESS